MARQAGMNAMQSMQPITQPAMQPVDNGNLQVDKSAILALAQKNGMQNASFPQAVPAPQQSFGAGQINEQTQPAVSLGANQVLSLFGQQPNFKAASNYNQFATQGAYSAFTGKMENKTFDKYAMLANYSNNTSNNPQLQRTGDPEADLEKYAEQKNISKEQARAELEAMFGKPEKRNASQGLSIVA